ncbi:MAG TPA: hypothetical protein G4N92_00475 [Anaerolineae bacterium]|nr:hypothetical protein [Anaerolineae bacterium]
MVDYIIYGKIIIDDIRLSGGEMVRCVLGGGGPQAAFGARLWSPSVGILTRSGTDIEPEPKAALENLDIDLQGWMQYENIPTPHSVMAYDENEYMVDTVAYDIRINTFMEKMGYLLSKIIPIPADYQNPKVIHLITEFVDEPMANKALEMKENGSIYSLEPLIDYRNWFNREAMMNYFQYVDIVTPDWPSASGLAGSDIPKEVVRFWSKLGPTCVAIRDGVRGSYVWDKETDKMWHIPIVRIKSIDPTGCGNSYGGGFCVGWEKNHDARKAGCCGTVSASYLAKNISLPPFTKEMEQEAQKIWEELFDRVETM